MKIAELKEYRKILNNVQSIEKQIISLESQINKITSVVNDTPRGGKTQDKSELICKLVDLREQYKTTYSAAVKKLKKIEAAIEQLNDPREQAVLRFKYIVGLPMFQICEELHYERTKVYEIHMSAIKNLEKIKTRTKTDTNM